jgi:hypothetical protein
MFLKTAQRKSVSLAALRLILSADAQKKFDEAEGISWSSR